MKKIAMILVITVLVGVVATVYSDDNSLKQKIENDGVLSLIHEYTTKPVYDWVLKPMYDYVLTPIGRGFAFTVTNEN